MPKRSRTGSRSNIRSERPETFRYNGSDKDAYLKLNAAEVADAKPASPSKKKGEATAATELVKVDAMHDLDPVTRLHHAANSRTAAIRSRAFTP